MFGQDIKLEIDGIKNLGGNLMIAIFDDETSFKNKENPVFDKIVMVNDTLMEYVFTKIPIGEYAVAIYHDANSDGQLNTKKLGIPVEGVGFSGNHSSKLKKPKFTDCTFKHENYTQLNIKLFYLK